MIDEQQRPTAGVLTVVGAYALFASLWILLSDRALGLLFTDTQSLLRASMVKGWFFVAVTTLLLYGLVRRLARDLEAGHARELSLERERQQPPTMLVAIAEASDDAIFAKDADGRYLLFNDAAARFVGQPAAQVLGRDDRALFPAPQAERLMEIDRRVRSSGQAETGEEVLQTANGVRVFLATKGPLRGADGRIFGSYGIARDITGLQQDEQARRRLAQDMEATLQAIPDLMFEIDARGRYLKVKAINESLLAAPAEQLLGRTVADILPAEATATVMAAVAAATRSGADFGRTVSLPLPEGLRHFELSVARKRVIDGEEDRFIVLSRDISERVRVETELRQRNEELERINRAATDRELRMVDLKREVNALALAAGRPAPYDTSFADGPPTGTAR